MGDITWKSIERDVRADFARFEPGLAVTAVNGFDLRAGNLYLDDLRLGPAGAFRARRFEYAAFLTQVDAALVRPGNSGECPGTLCITLP